MKSKFILLLVVTVILTAGIAVYSLTWLEVTQSHYESYDELASVPNVFEAGWIPRWIPRSAMDIDESHDIDTNESWLVFSFAKGDSFYSVCRELPSSNVTRPSKTRAQNFPSFVGRAVAEIHNNNSLRYYSCEKNDKRIMAVDVSRSLAYVWIMP